MPSIFPENICDSNTSPANNEPDTSNDSASVDDLDGFGPFDIDYAALGICTPEMVWDSESQTNAIDLQPKAESSEQFIDMSSPITISDDGSSCIDKSMKRRKIDTSNCYQIRNFGRRVERQFQMTDIVHEWTDTDSICSVYSQQQDRIPVEAVVDEPNRDEPDRDETDRDDADRDDCDIFSVSSTSSFGVIRHRNGDFIVRMPAKVGHFVDDGSTVYSVSDAE